MNIKINQDNTRTEINVPDSVVEILYQEVKDYETHDSSDLSGLIEINHGYIDAVNFLNTNYPRFRCRTLGDPYVRFEDPLVESMLVERFYTWNPRMGDGVGLTMSDLNNAPSTYYLLAFNNTEITKFNEFRYLTRYKDIQGGTFKNCAKLEEVDLTNIEKISGSSGGGAFQGCVKLTNINLPICTQLTSPWGFYGCTNLTTFNAPEAIGSLGGSFFANCSSLVNLNIPKIQGLSNDDFSGCSSLTTIYVPEVSGNIPSKLFYNCSSLSNLTIGEITSIYGQAFDGCSSLTSIDLSNCTKLEGNYIFSQCRSLISLGDTSNITSLSGTGIFTDCSSLTGTFDLSNSICDGTLTSTFLRCTGLTKIKLGTVNSIGSRWHTYDNNRRAFYGCTNLVTIDINQLNYIWGGNGPFGNTPALRNFIIRNTDAIPEKDSETTNVAIEAFGGSNVKVYVDDSLLNTYKTAVGWENMVDYLYPISEFVE